MSSPGRACILALAMGSLAVAGSAVNLTYVDLGAGGGACCLVADGQGNRYVVGSADGDVSVTRLDAANRVTGSFTFGGGGSDEPRAAALDAAGNLVIGGQTGSSDFPLVHALIAQTEPGAPAGFVTKVNPASGQILFSTRIGGLAAERPVRLGSAVNAVAVDAAGNVYAGGSTNAADFPVSSDAFQKTGAGGGSLIGARPYGFVIKLAAAGDRMVYSTLLGGATANCIGGSHCVDKTASNSVNAIAVDDSGRATVGGGTNAPDFPVTAGAMQSVCHCQEYAGSGFVARLNAGGSGLVWSTFLGGSWYGFSQVPAGTNTVDTLALDASGEVVAAGRTDADDFPVTAGALQPKFGGAATQQVRSTDGFLARLNGTGTALVFSTYLGGSSEDRIRVVRADPQGNLWVTGTTESGDFPGGAAAFTGSFFAEVAADGTRLMVSQRAPAGAAGQSVVAGAEVTVLGASGSVLQVAAGQAQDAAILGVASAAAGGVKGAVAPGEIVSLYGIRLGPAQGVGAALDSEGRVATELAGVRVRFNGIAAPLLYVSEGQVNALAPYGIAGSASASLQVTTAAGDTPAVSLYVRAAQPEVFRSGASAAALNQDGSVNSAANPAAPGSVVSVFASGAGTLFTSLPDGAMANGAGGGPVLPLAVLYEGRSLEVLYAGYAPGLIANLLQINFRLPPRGTGGSYQVTVGGFDSGNFAIAVE